LTHQEGDGIAPYITGEAVEDTLPEVHRGRGSAVFVERAPDLLVAVLVAAVLDAVLLEDPLDRNGHGHHGQCLWAKSMAAPGERKLTYLFGAAATMPHEGPCFSSTQPQVW
jgi:hypothetical protein